MIKSFLCNDLYTSRFLSICLKSNTLRFNKYGFIQQQQEYALSPLNGEVNSKRSSSNNNTNISLNNKDASLSVTQINGARSASSLTDDSSLNKGDFNKNNHNNKKHGED